ncbi:MAG: DUF4386 domain-containing protein [Bacteroidota bacterium]
MPIEVRQTNTLNKLRVLYPVWMILGIFSIIYVPSVILDSTDGIATAENIAKESFLFRLGIVGRLITQILFIIIPYLLYTLLKEVNKGNAVLMMVFAYISIPITMYIESHKLGLPALLDQPELILQSLASYNHGLNIAMIFWGLWLLPLAALCLESSYFPKFIGIVLMIAGIGYSLGSFSRILFPEQQVFLQAFEIMTFGEMVFIFYLLIMGIKKEPQAVIRSLA